VAILWAPKPQHIEDAVLVERVEAMTFAGRSPMSEESVSLLAAISKAILASPFARSQPQYVALGYWLRPAALERMCQSLRSRMTQDHNILVPRGIALHLPPTNVDTIFVYSWAMSVLAGNCNIVRLPSEVDAGTGWLAEMIAEVIAKAGEDKRQLFCQLLQNSGVIEDISAHCDLRMIWGGDAKVKSVSQTPIRPDGLSIGFPDRKSLAIIKSEAYHNADDATRDALAGKFFNDVYWFNQMGCGSPRIVYWIGEPKELVEDFYARLNRQIIVKAHKTETGVVIEKFTLLNDMLAVGTAQSAKAYSNALHIVETDQPELSSEKSRGGGILSHTVVHSITDIAVNVTRKVQTIGHFGFDDFELRLLAHAIINRGGYRIVPIGQALQFDIIWDGLELLRHMTRQISIII
jgi:hypothetical protein